ncbi:hypothetical protein MK079_02125 [Candidatus Gracilibacteria bacterium]|nr:hypothetical protein [Candidatus Gracilibacteria bacterium]
MKYIKIPVSILLTIIFTYLGVQAWTTLSSVNSGDALSANLWNTFISNLNELNTRTSHITNSGANTSFQLTDGNQANGNILVSDANGNASWQDGVLSEVINYPTIVMPALTNASLPAGGSITSGTVNLDRGLYLTSFYRCANQINAVGGMNVLLCPTSDCSNNSQWDTSAYRPNDASFSDCGTYHTSILRVESDNTTIYRRYQSYGGSYFNCSGCTSSNNSERIIFSRIQ